MAYKCRLCVGYSLTTMVDLCIRAKREEYIEYKATRAKQ